MKVVPGSIANTTFAPPSFTTGKAVRGQGRSNNEPAEVGALEGRVEKLERLVGKLTLKNGFLERPVRTASVGLPETPGHEGMRLPRCYSPMGA